MTSITMMNELTSVAVNIMENKVRNYCDECFMACSLQHVNMKCNATFRLLCNSSADASLPLNASDSSVIGAHRTPASLLKSSMNGAEAGVCCGHTKSLVVMRYSRKGSDRRAESASVQNERLQQLEGC